MSAAAPPLSVAVSTGPTSSPLSSPSFSLAPQRSSALRMHTPTSATHAHSGEGHRPASTYSLRGGRAGGERRHEFDERADRGDRGDREHRADRPERTEREPRIDRPDRRADRDSHFSDRAHRGGGSAGPRGDRGLDRDRDRGDFPKAFRGAAADRREERPAEKKQTPSQIYANAQPVSALVEAPPSPTLPPAFHTAPSPQQQQQQRAAPNFFSVLDDADADAASPTARVDAVDADLPFDSFPLAHRWTLFFDRKTPAGKGKTAALPPKPTQGGHADPLASYESSLHTIGHFGTVHEFWSLQNHLHPPSSLDQNTTLHVFKSGIKPVWEDDANRAGGKFIFRIASKDKSLLDHCWQNVLLACIGGTMDPDDEVCGVVLSRRRMGDRIAVWNRHKEDSPQLIALGHRFRAAMMEGLAPEQQPTVTLSYEDNAETLRVGFCAMGSNVRFNL